ncbi:MAG: hypothetical protein U5N85_04190 [Arcicella sp.]|nr:hypothetical protein [Arcicella sp.]
MKKTLIAIFGITLFFATINWSCKTIEIQAPACNFPKGVKAVSFATAYYGNRKQASTANCFEIDSCTAGYDANKTFCGFTKHGCDYDVVSHPSTNSIIIDSSGYNTLHVFKNGIPDKYKTLSCCEIYKDIRKVSVKPIKGFENTVEDVLEASTYRYLFHEKGAVSVSEGTVENSGFVKFDATTILETNRDTYGYVSLPDTVYAKTTQLISPTYTGRLKSPEIRRIWTTSSTLKIDEKGNINVPQSRATLPNSYDNVYYQLVNNPQIYRIRVLFILGNGIKRLNKAERTRYYEVQLANIDKSNPCSLLKSVGGGPPAMLIIE